MNKFQINTYCLCYYTYYYLCRGATTFSPHFDFVESDFYCEASHTIRDLSNTRAHHRFCEIQYKITKRTEKITRPSAKILEISKYNHDTQENVPQSGLKSKTLGNLYKSLKGSILEHSFPCLNSLSEANVKKIQLNERYVRAGLSHSIPLVARLRELIFKCFDLLLDLSIKKNQLFLLKIK
ncbi:hypothetical protein BpHYR1_049343 [Brachionus plicatilis]|uniref:Uncharacterized protein n=1 Tax=Brachionus plicatilis TaxID=10195 RepID=A0A3M7SEQ3_BRAPC|nr:hypothetical protein BpHYR1_049343 [Brachionus plicatilis]